MIVDDESLQTRSFAKLFSNEFDVVQVNVPSEALKVLDNSFCVAIVDERMGTTSGIDVLRDVRLHFPNVTRVLMTAYGDEYLASAVNKARIFHYVEKPFGEELRELLRDAVREYHLRQRGIEQLRWLERERDLLAGRPAGRAAFREAFGFSAVVGNSKGISELIEKSRKAVDQEFTVLIGGETGTGKGVLAKAIHYEGSRRDFRLFNCGGCFDESLTRSELFGSVPGGFTGAVNQPGIFEVADGGTVFLDEIGELPPKVQALLLTFLDSSEFTRVGNTRLLRTDVRLIAATNKNLYEEVKAKRFREDLYYRLAQFEISLPSLRERCDDIPLLVEHFLQHASIRTGRRSLSLSEEALTLLCRYPFPGNIRELQTAINRAAAICDEQIIEAQDLPDRIRQQQPLTLSPMHDAKPFLTQRKDEVECMEVRKAIASSKTQKEAAQKLGRSDRWLREKLKDCD